MRLQQSTIHINNHVNYSIVVQQTSQHTIMLTHCSHWQVNISVLCSPSSCPPSVSQLFNYSLPSSPVIHVREVSRIVLHGLQRHGLPIHCRGEHVVEAHSVVSGLPHCLRLRERSCSVQWGGVVEWSREVQCRTVPCKSGAVCTYYRWWISWEWRGSGWMRAFNKSYAWKMTVQHSTVVQYSTRVHIPVGEFAMACRRRRIQGKPRKVTRLSSKLASCTDKPSADMPASAPHTAANPTVTCATPSLGWCTVKSLYWLIPKPGSQSKLRAE